MPPHMPLIQIGAIRTSCHELQAFYPNEYLERSPLINYHRLRQGCTTVNLLLQHFFPSIDGYRITPLGHAQQDLFVVLTNRKRRTIPEGTTSIIAVERLREDYYLQSPPLRPVEGLLHNAALSDAFRLHVMVLLVADDPRACSLWTTPNDCYNLLRTIAVERHIQRGPAIIFYGNRVEFLLFDSRIYGCKIAPFPFRSIETSHFTRCTAANITLLDMMFREVAQMAVSYDDGSKSNPPLENLNSPKRFSGFNERAQCVAPSIEQEESGGHNGSYLESHMATSESPVGDKGFFDEVLGLLACYNDTHRAPSYSPISEVEACRAPSYSPISDLDFTRGCET